MASVTDFAQIWRSLVRKLSFRREGELELTTIKPQDKRENINESQSEIYQDSPFPNQPSDNSIDQVKEKHKRVEHFFKDTQLLHGELRKLIETKLPILHGGSNGENEDPRKLLNNNLSKFFEELKDQLFPSRHKELFNNLEKLLTENLKTGPSDLTKSPEELNKQRSVTEEKLKNLYEKSKAFTQTLKQALEPKQADNSAEWNWLEATLNPDDPLRKGSLRDGRGGNLFFLQRSLEQLTSSLDELCIAWAKVKILDPPLLSPTTTIAPSIRSSIHSSITAASPRQQFFPNQEVLPHSTWQANTEKESGAEHKARDRQAALSTPASIAEPVRHFSQNKNLLQSIEEKPAVQHRSNANSVIRPQSEQSQSLRSNVSEGKKVRVPKLNLQRRG